MLKIDYDVTIPEMETGFMLHWRKYALRRTILLSVVYAIGIALFVKMALRGGNGPLIGGIGSGLAAGMLISLWLKPRRARKKLVAALELMYEEKYTAIFGENTIEIETVVQSEEDEAVEKTEYTIATEELFGKETPELFLMFVNRALIHVFPKRCMTDETVENLREYFNKKGI
jgi:hypothetical protein